MQAVERALDVALIFMRNGCSTVLADQTFNNILKGYKQNGVSAAWRKAILQRFCGRSV
jgi:hypothetical protein